MSVWSLGFYVVLSIVMTAVFAVTSENNLATYDKIAYAIVTICVASFLMMRRVKGLIIVMLFIPVVTSFIGGFWLTAVALNNLIPNLDGTIITFAAIFVGWIGLCNMAQAMGRVEIWFTNRGYAL